MTQSKVIGMFLVCVKTISLMVSLGSHEVAVASDKTDCEMVLSQVTEMSTILGIHPLFLQLWTEGLKWAEAEPSLSQFRNIFFPPVWKSILWMESHLRRRLDIIFSYANLRAYEAYTEEFSRMVDQIQVWIDNKDEYAMKGKVAYESFLSLTYRFALLMAATQKRIQDLDFSENNVAGTLRSIHDIPSVFVSEAIVPKLDTVWNGELLWPYQMLVPVPDYLLTPRDHIKMLATMGSPILLKPADILKSTDVDPWTQYMTDTSLAHVSAKKLRQAFGEYGFSWEKPMGTDPPPLWILSLIRDRLIFERYRQEAVIRESSPMFREVLETAYYLMLYDSECPVLPHPDTLKRAVDFENWRELFPRLHTYLQTVHSSDVTKAHQWYRNFSRRHLKWWYEDR